MIRAALDRLYLYSGYLAGAFMVAIFVLMMVLSAGRPVGLNIPAADDFVSWCMAAMAFLGLAHTFRNGEMIRVGLLIDNLPEKSRHWIELVCLVIGIGLIAFVDEFIHVVRGNLPRYEKPKPQTAEEVVERAVQSGV